MRYGILLLCVLSTGCAAREGPGGRSAGWNRPRTEERALAGYLHRLGPALQTFNAASAGKNRASLETVVGPVLFSSGFPAECLVEGIRARTLRTRLDLEELRATQSVLDALAPLETTRPLLPHDPRVNRAIRRVERDVLAQALAAKEYVRSVSDAVECLAKEWGMDLCDPKGLYRCPP